MNKLNLVIPLVLALLLVLPLASAGTTYGVTIIGPSTGATLSGTNLNKINITINLTNAAAVANSSAWNCSFYMKSASTANSSWSVLSNGTNKSFTTNAATNTTLGMTKWNSTDLEDSNNYYFNVSCKDNNSIIEEGSATSIVIDNTVPDAATSLSPTNNFIDDDNTVAFSASVTDSKTTGCTLYYGRAGGSFNAYTMTYSTSSCTYAGWSNIINDVYSWYVLASDGTNTTASATYQFDESERLTSKAKKYAGTVGGVSPAAKVYLAITEPQILGLSLLEIIGILAVAVAIIILVARGKKVYYPRK